MTKKPEYQDTNYKVSSTYPQWEIGRGKYDYDKGVLTTLHGYIKMYAQGDKRFRNLTRLTFIWNGRQHERQWQHRYSRQYMVTLAKRFVAEIIKSGN